MKHLVGVTDVLRLVAASIAMAAPISAGITTLPAQSSHASDIAHSHFFAKSLKVRSLGEAISAQDELTSRSTAAERISIELEQLLPRTPATLDLLSKVGETPSRTTDTLDLLSKIGDAPSHVAHGVEMPGVGSSVAGGSNGISTELRLLTGGSGVPAHTAHTQGQAGATAKTTSTALVTPPRNQPLLGRARFRSQTRGPLASLQTVPAPVPPSRALVAEDRVHIQPIPRTIANVDHSFNDASAVAERSRTASPQPPRVAHETETASVGDASKSPHLSVAKPVDPNSALDMFAKRQANLFKIYVDESKTGSEHALELIKAQEYIVSKYAELKVESSATAHALVRQLELADDPLELLPAGIVRPSEFSTEIWREAVRLIHNRNTAHKYFGMYQTRLAALEKTSAHKVGDVAGGTSNYAGSSLNRDEGTNGASSSAPTTGAETGAGSKRPSASDTDSTPPPAKRPRTIADLEDFIQKQKDIFDLFHKDNSQSTRRRREYPEAVELERHIFSRLKELKPTSDEHAEELLRIVESSKSAKTLAQTGIVMPERTHPTHWSNAVKAIYGRNKANVWMNTYAAELRELREERLRAQARVDAAKKPK